MSPTESEQASHSDSASQPPTFMGGLPLPPRTPAIASPALKYEGYYGTYRTNPVQTTQTLPSRLHNVSQSQGPNFMSFPPELRMKILSNALTSITGPSGTISINPRAKTLSDPQGEFHGHDCSAKGQTKWQARSGVLQACHQLREEALEILYHEARFFARMSQCEDGEFSFERRCFDRWLRSLGSDAEICRVRSVTFGVEWTSLVDRNGRFERRKGEVNVAFDRGKVMISGSKKIAECPAEPLLQLEKLVAQIMFARPKGMEFGMGYEEWMKVWDKVQMLMKSGWGSPY